MTAMFCNEYSNCCSAAAACSSAFLRPILDTALLLAVSICILCLRITLLLM